MSMGHQAYINIDYCCLEKEDQNGNCNDRLSFFYCLHVVIAQRGPLLLNPGGW